MPLDFTITTSSDSISKESPIILNDLVELLTNHLEPLDVDTIDTNQLNTFILKQCQLKSSKYKFLVQSTKLSSPNTVDSDLDISSTFGAFKT
ncbi:hypothetical protein DFJ63DRAFT_334016 [Scheffersomyces coipomensis]|uniref:uncharacterized protein n=1 Tax=Scheffersomyces coipomensis TaxID=1788519 RepID=UPI00315DCEBE